MFARRHIALGLLFLMGACSKHPLEGHWHQHVEGGHGMTLEFDAASDRVLVHGAGADHGSHDHLRGTYRLDGKSVAVHGKWDHSGVQVSWQGEIEGDTLRLQGADGSHVFHRGSHDR